MAIKQAKSGKKSKTVPKVQKKPKVIDEDVDMESDSDNDTSEEEVPVMVKPKANGSSKKAKKTKVEEESEEDSEDEEVTPKKAASKKVVKQTEESDDEEEEDEEEEESEDEEEQTKPKGKAPLAQMEDDDDDEEEDDDDEEADDDDEEDEESEEETPKKQKVKASKKQKEEEEDDEDDEEEEEEEEEEESDEEVTEKTSKKRKAKETKTPAKKQKVEETVTIKVSNIAESVSDEKLVKFLKERGVETTSFRRNVKRGYGFLDLADPDTLSTALSLSGEKLKGSILTIEKAEAKKPGEKGSPEKGGKQLYGEDKDKLTLFMKNLPFEADEDKIKEVFPNATEVRLAKRPDGSLRGFGFVEFSTEEEVDAAMEANQGTEIGGRAVMLDFMGSKAKNRPSGGDKSRSRGEAGKTKVLFVGNLSFDTTVESLKEAFEGCSDARIIYRDDGKSKGIGFVEYDSADDAKAALDSMTGAEVDGRQINLDFATERGSGGGGRGGFRGGRGGFRGGRGRGGGRGGRGGFGDRRGGGGFRGGRGGTPRRDGFQNFQGRKKTFDD